LLLQAALVVLPVAVLSLIALFSLRQDKATVLQDARNHAAPSIRDLAARLGPRIAQLIATEKPLEGFIADGRIQSPPDSGSLLQPADWPFQLSPKDARFWQQAQAAMFQHEDSVAARNALNSLKFFSESPSARANADLLLLDLDHPFAAGAFVDLARRYPDVLTDSGAPLPAVALLHVLRAAPQGPLPNGFLPEITRQVHGNPSFLTGQVLEMAEKIPNLDSYTELRRLHHEWTDWQTTIDVLHTVLKSPPPAGTAFQHWTPDKKLLTLGEPFLGGWKVSIFPRDAVSQLFSRAFNGLNSDVPVRNASLFAYFAGQRLYLTGPVEPSTTIAAAAEGSFSFSGPRPFTLLVAADESALYSGHRTRLWQMTALILCAALAALIGLAALWRSHQRQARLNQLKSNFVSSVSHELRAPLGAVRLMAENLEREKVPDPAQQKEYFRLIGQECRRLTSLIENVLDFSRMETGRKQYTFEPVDLVPLLQHTVAVMEPVAAAREITLRFTPPTETPQPCWDAAAIEQSLVNLVDNAIKHSPAGAAVRLEIESLENGFRLWVKDSGPGIPPDEQQRIFDLFYRRGSELRRETTGAGIGLTIVKHVAEAHGGCVIVVSEVGKGSQFALELPFGSVHA
jgi:signal transduction histidine kinase